MDYQKISGKWAGEYILGKEYPENERDTAVSFIIEMDCLEGAITGTCNEEVTKKIFKKPAVIEGFFDNGVISFIKKYPCLWAADENGNDKLYPHVPSQRIHYFGTFEQTLLSTDFYGEWEMCENFIDGNGIVVPIVSTGTWTMRKQHK